MHLSIAARAHLPSSKSPAGMPTCARGNMQRCRSLATVAGIHDRLGRCAQASADQARQDRGSPFATAELVEYHRAYRAGRNCRLGMVVGRTRRRVVACEATVVLRQAERHEISKSKVDGSDRPGAVKGEVGIGSLGLASRRHGPGQSYAQPADVDPDGGDAKLKEQTSPPGQVRAMPGQPIGKEQDVPAFLLNDRRERLDQLRRKKAGEPRQVEETECKEAVDALGVSGNQECPFHVARRLVGWLFKQLDPDVSSSLERTCLWRFSSQAFNRIVARMSASSSELA